MSRYSSDSHLEADFKELRLKEGFSWPNKKRLPILITIDFHAETAVPTLEGHRDYHETTERQYGGRVGIWRLLDLLDKYDAKATFPTCGFVAEKHPDAVKEIVKRGHELAGHGYHHENVWKLTREKENQLIRKTVQKFEDVTGEHIVGWRTARNWPSENTAQLLMENGFVWRSDLLNDDMAYVLKSGDRMMAELPYTYGTADVPMFFHGSTPIPGDNATARFHYGSGAGTSSNAFSIWRDEFEVLYREALREPRIFLITLHDFITGRAGRTRTLEMLLKYIKAKNGVWFARCIDVAKICLNAVA